MNYHWLKIIWSFHRNPTDIFVEGSFWKSFVHLVFKEGRDLFDGVEMGEQLAKITANYYGKHAMDICKSMNIFCYLFFSSTLASII